MIEIVLSRGELDPNALMELEALSIFKKKAQTLSTEDIHFFKKGDIIISKNCFFMFKAAGEIVTNTIYHNEMPVGEIQYRVISNKLHYSVEILSNISLLSFFLTYDEIEIIAKASCHIYVLCMMYLKWIKLAYKNKYIHGIRKEYIFSNTESRNFTLDVSPKNKDVLSAKNTYTIPNAKRKWIVRSHKRRMKSGKIAYVRGHIKGKGYLNINEQQSNLFDLMNEHHSRLEIMVG